MTRPYESHIRIAGQLVRRCISFDFVSRRQCEKPAAHVRTDLVIVHKSGDLVWDNRNHHPLYAEERFNMQGSGEPLQRHDEPGAVTPEVTLNGVDLTPFIKGAALGGHLKLGSHLKPIDGGTRHGANTKPRMSTKSPSQIRRERCIDSGVGHRLGNHLPICPDLPPQMGAATRADEEAMELRELGDQAAEVAEAMEWAAAMEPSDPDFPLDEELKAGIRTFNHPALTELADWWRSVAEEEIQRTVPKALEYSATDLADIGHVLARTAGRTVTDEEAAELGVFFYLQGKLSRWAGAVMDGRRPSDDTVFDMGIYIRMAQRIRATGSWPGVNLP